MNSKVKYQTQNENPLRMIPAMLYLFVAVYFLIKKEPSQLRWFFFINDTMDLNHIFSL